MDRPIMPRTEKPLLGLELAGMGVALMLFAAFFVGIEQPGAFLPGGALAALGVWDWAKTRRKR